MRARRQRTRKRAHARAARSTFSKNDWLSWVAAMAHATGDDASFHTLIDAVYRFADSTPDRIPLTDWYWADKGTAKGFRCRPVIGAFSARMLLA